MRFHLSGHEVSIWLTGATEARVNLVFGKCGEVIRSVDPQDLDLEGSLEVYDNYIKFDEPWAGLRKICRAVCDLRQRAGLDVLPLHLDVWALGVWTGEQRELYEYDCIKEDFVQLHK